MDRLPKWAEKLRIFDEKKLRSSRDALHICASILADELRSKRRRQLFGPPLGRLCSLLHFETTH
jgi:hypothetical protein